jgi:hypothetical protein
MTDQPPDKPSGHPARPPGQANPPTQPMTASANIPTAANPAGALTVAPTKSGWHQMTFTRGRRWAIAIAAGVLACLMLLGIGVAGLLVLRNHDRFGMTGQRQGGFSRLFGQGNGRGSRGNDGYHPVLPGGPGMRGRAQGLGGLGGLLGGTALHGNVTAMVNGSVQALVFQRGAVSAVSATSVTLKSSDGFIGTYGRSSATNSMMAAPVTGGQALVLARASDKVAITIVSTPANAGVAPSN